MTDAEPYSVCLDSLYNRRVKSDLVMCYIRYFIIMSVSMLIHSFLDVLSTSHAGIVPNYTHLLLCQFAMAISSLMLGIHYLTLLFRRVPLRVLNIDCNL